MKAEELSAVEATPQRVRAALSWWPRARRVGREGRLLGLLLVMLTVLALELLILQHASSRLWAVSLGVTLLVWVAVIIYLPHLWSALHRAVIEVLLRSPRVRWYASEHAILAIRRGARGWVAVEHVRRPGRTYTGQGKALREAVLSTPEGRSAAVSCHAGTRTLAERYQEELGRTAVLRNRGLFYVIKRPASTKKDSRTPSVRPY